MRDEVAIRAEKRRKSVVEEYFRRLNAGDADGVLDLLTEDVRIEDPIGGGGPRERRAYVTGQVDARVQITPGYVVASHDDEQVAVPYTEHRHGRTTDTLGVFRIDPQGLIKELRTFRGFDDEE